MRIFIDRVIDGDSFATVINKNFFDMKLTTDEYFFRLDGIDAPEKTGETKAAGLASMEYLKGRIQGQKVKIKFTAAKKRDKYGRYLVTVYKDGVNINAELVELGLAIYRTY